MRAMQQCFSVVVFVAVALGGVGGCTNHSIVFDPGRPLPPGRYGLFAAGADQPVATHELQEGELFGTAYEQGVLGGSQKRSELVLRTEQDAHVTVRRIAVDGKQQYAWRRMAEGQK